MFMSNFIHLPRKRSSVTWTPSVTLSRVCACVRALVGAHGLMVYHHYSVSDIRTASTPIYFTSSTLPVACLLVNAISNFIWELTPQRGCVPDQPQYASLRRMKFAGGLPTDATLESRFQ
jgi:hypothetical protein